MKNSAVTPDYLAGFGRTDITPTQSVPLAGYGHTSTRMSEGIYTRLYATAIAVTDQDNQSVMLLTMDLINPRGGIAPLIRNGIAEKTGLPVGHIFVTFTHNHSGPDLDNDEATPYVEECITMVVRQTVAAAEAAWKDRKPAELYTGVTKVEGLNFIRQYKRGPATEAGPGPIEGHRGPSDPEIRLIRFRRDGGKDLVLMNWQCHGVLNSHLLDKLDIFKLVSADYIEGVRKFMEEEGDCCFAFFQGAGGDMNSDSLIPEENPTRDIYEYGRRLGTPALQCLRESMVKAEVGPIRVCNFDFSGRVNHDGEDMMEQVNKVRAYLAEKGAPGATPYARSLGLISWHHANAIVRRKAMGATMEIPCAVLSIGPVGFAAAPNELFSDAGIAIRKGSPFPMTFILGYCNFVGGYMPIMRAYDYNSYEVACSNFARGTAEEMVETYNNKWAELQP